uniref:Uncharacterized protein n=1 Tax=Trichuris muris TaxID=70415 RepID=A0A5S6R5D1_TRIMR
MHLNSLQCYGSKFCPFKERPIWYGRGPRSAQRSPAKRGATSARKRAQEEWFKSGNGEDEQPVAPADRRHRRRFPPALHKTHRYACNFREVFVERAQQPSPLCDYSSSGAAVRWWQLGARRGLLTCKQPAKGGARE